LERSLASCSQIPVEKAGFNKSSSRLPKTRGKEAGYYMGISSRKILAGINRLQLPHNVETKE